MASALTMKYADGDIPKLLPGIPTVTVGTKIATTINVAVQLRDITGRSLAKKTPVRVWISGAPGDTSTVTPPNGTVVIGTDGILIASPVAKLDLDIMSSAAGKFDLSITDSGSPAFYLNVEHAGQVTSSAIIQF